MQALWNISILMEPHPGDPEAHKVGGVGFLRVNPSAQLPFDCSVRSHFYFQALLHRKCEGIRLMRYKGRWNVICTNVCTFII